jgi:superfamily II DNA/RNA helicase
MIKFSDLNLDPKVMKAIADTGYETPTPIQAGAIPPALEGRDVLGIAQTGTGKTASFVLPMITMLSKGRARARMPRSLVLAPTRELAAQVAENFDNYAKYTKLTKALLIGGVSFKEQDQLIDRGVDVLIATPGRLLDHFERGKLLLTGVQIMVVDEADRMLDMGFIPDIERIFAMTPFTRQTLFFSATMAPEIERITNTFLSNPAKVEVARAATTSKTIEQAVVMFKPTNKAKQSAEKREILRAIIESEGEACSNAIIFCNRKTDVDIVAKSLKNNGYNAEPIHGDLEQSKRMQVLQGFRDGTIRFLCASDVAARGLDIPNVTHVFNYDVPSHAEDYVHRIGRTGRAGRSGKAFMICAPSDDKNFDAIEHLVKETIPRIENPLGTKAPTADAAPAEQAEPRKTSSRSRSRSRSAPRSEPTPSVTEPQPAAVPVVEAQEQVPEAQVAAVKEPAPEISTEQPEQVARSSSRSRAPTQSSNRNSGGGRNDKQVVGMGDHMPTFIAKSFDERRTS